MNCGIITSLFIKQMTRLQNHHPVHKIQEFSGTHKQVLQKFTSNLGYMSSLQLHCTTVKGDSLPSGVGPKGTDKSSPNEPNINNELNIPEPPTDCCMSGCANCVWIQYAEDLMQKFSTSSKEARDIIISKINDPSMKSFLSIELNNLEDESKWRPQKDNMEEPGKVK